MSIDTWYYVYSKRGNGKRYRIVKHTTEVIYEQ